MRLTNKLTNRTKERHSLKDTAHRDRPTQTKRQRNRHKEAKVYNKKLREIDRGRKRNKKRGKVRWREAVRWGKEEEKELKNESKRG